MLENSCKEFLDQLASAAPVPGGGGASAFCSAQGVALGMMVGNLTLGKKKYAIVQEEVQSLLASMQEVKEDLEDLVVRDAQVFEPLSKAYGLPSATEAEQVHKAGVMEDALKEACSVPLQIMEKSAKALTQMERMGQIGTKIALSDVGVGVQFLKAGILGSAMNVYTNTRLMKDEAYATACNFATAGCIASAVALADSIYQQIEEALKCPS